MSASVRRRLRSVQPPRSARRATVPGYPNGRRVSDDVTDIASRVVAGVLAGAPFNGFPHNRIGDGVNVNDAPYQETFPYVGFAQDGVTSAHDNP